MTSLEMLYCRKEFQLADIPLSGVSGVMAAVTVESEGTVFVWATLVRSICFSLCPVGFSVGIVGLN